MTTRIYAHRGASVERPENTLAAFARALELGVDGIELDVHLTADGVPVVIHDETVDRTTNGSGAVASMHLESISALDAGQRQRIPTLGEVLDLIDDRVHMDIEVKAAAAGRAVLEEARGRPNLLWAISSFDHGVLRNIRAIDKHADLWPLTPSASDGVLKTIRDLGASTIAIWDRGIDQDIVEHVRQAGARCWVWTVNDPERAREISKWDIAGICTDDPRALLATRGDLPLPTVDG